MDLDVIPNLIECKSSFEKSRVKPDENVTVKVYLRSNTDVPLKIRRIAICLLTSSNTNHRYEAEKGAELEMNIAERVERTSNEFRAVDFMLESGKCYKFQVEVNPRHFMENVEIGVSFSRIAAEELITFSLKPSPLVCFTDFRRRVNDGNGEKFCKSCNKEITEFNESLSTL